MEEDEPTQAKAKAPRVEVDIHNTSISNSLTNTNRHMLSSCCHFSVAMGVLADDNWPPVGSQLQWFL